MIGVTPPTASHKPGFGTGAGGTDPGGKVRIFPLGSSPTPFPFFFFPPSFPFLFFPPFPFKAFFAQTSVFVVQFAVFEFGFFCIERQNSPHTFFFFFVAIARKSLRTGATHWSSRVIVAWSRGARIVHGSGWVTVASSVCNVSGVLGTWPPATCESPAATQRRLKDKIQDA